MTNLYLEKSDLVDALCGEAIPDGHSLREIENAVDALFYAEWETGRDEGFAEGAEAGQDDGYQQGWDDGEQEGWEKGFARGLEEGGE